MLTGLPPPSYVTHKISINNLLKNKWSCTIDRRTGRGGGPKIVLEDRLNLLAENARFFDLYVRILASKL